MARVVVVTGAASGIGLGVAQRFAADGDAVALLDRDAEAAEREAATIREQGGSALARAVDVADWSAVHAAFDQVRAELGPVAALVTSAGVEAFEPAVDISERYRLHVYRATIVAGDPVLREHAELRWFAPAELDEADWLIPDRPFVRRLRELL